jgi:succinate dehydrogenase / fumarate reductase flavoprotein subunit
MIQVHPTCVPGEDKLRLMSESARGEGGRVWVPKQLNDKRAPRSIPESERWYFLEEWYPKYGNLVPRDVATRAIFKVVFEYNLGIDGQPMVYLDVTHIDRKILDKKLEGILEIYEKFVGDDPRDVPMKIFPGMHYTMGGMWVDYNQATNVPGLYACGECDYSIHGANRLGANSLMSCIYGGFVAGPEAVKYARNLASAPANGCYDAEKKRQEEFNQRLLKSDGSENPFRIWRELGVLMTKNCSVIRYNKALQETDAQLCELLERWRHVNLSDKSMWTNSSFAFARQLYNMLQLSRVITQGALMRDESRGSHYKPDFPDRDDVNWLKTTKAYFAADADEPRFEFEPVDTSLLPLRLRKY